MARRTVSKKWALQDAKNKLSEVVDEAARHGPQIITRRGVETAVVLSFDDFAALSRGKNESLADFLLASPLGGSGLELDRSSDTGRKVKL